MKVCNNCKKELLYDFIRVSFYGSKIGKKYNIDNSNKDFCSLKCFIEYFELLTSEERKLYEEIVKEVGLRGVEK